MVLLAAGLVFALPAHQANAAGVYVSLGDSLAAGVGASVSSKGYVGRLNGAMGSNAGVDAFAGFGQAGATSGSLRGSQLTNALARINDPTDTTFVTIDIGGNDLLSGSCNGTWDTTCPFRANFAATLDDLLGALAGDPGAETLATMAYYNPSAGEGSPTEASRDTQLLGANGVINGSDAGADVGINDVILEESQSRSLPMANPYPAFDAAGQAWISGDGIHPNDEGYAAIAQSFCDVIAVSCAVSSPPPPNPPADADPPETRIDKAPKRSGHKRKVTVTFSSDERSSSFECSLDDKPFRDCDSPQRPRVSRGRHRFRVRAIDAAGNVDPTAASVRFRVKRKR